MISTIVKRNIKYTKAYNQYYYSFESKLHYPCFFTKGQGNIHRPHLWVCACVSVCMSVYAQMHVDRGKQCECECESRVVLRLCVWGLRGSVCACVCEAEMSLCACFHLATLNITVPRLPVNLSAHEMKGEAVVLLKCEQKLELFLHISAQDNIRGHFTSSYRLTLTPCSKGLLKAHNVTPLFSAG